MTSVKDHIWVSTTNGLWIINRETMDARQQNMTDKRFTSLLFDSKDGNVYLGGADGFAISRPEIQTMNRPERPILLTALYINNQLMDPRIANIPNIRYTNAIELKYNQNNLAFELSDLPTLSKKRINSFTGSEVWTKNGIFCHPIRTVLLIAI